MVAAVSGTNIDVNTLVTQLMAAERAPLAALQKTQSAFQARISAYGRLQGALGTLQDAARKLDSLDSFRAATAKAADASVLAASASPGAGAGSHSVEVLTLAQSHKLASGAFASVDTVVGTGTLTVQFGTYSSGTNTFTANAEKSALTLTIGAANNTLAGVRDAINAAGADSGVRASIINDGSGYRLSISATDAGTANSLKVSVDDDDAGDTDTSGLSRLAYNPAAAVGSGKNLVQTAAAQNASLVIDGIAVTKSSNSIEDAIPGLRLNLLKTNAGSPTTVTVGPDTDAMKATLENFVKAYNSFNTVSRDLTFYDAGSKKAGALQGDATARGVQAQVRAVLTAAVDGLPGEFTRLSQVGLTMQSDGSLSFDATKFQKAVEAHPADLPPLFTTTGRSTDSRVGFLGANSTLAPGTFAVSVSQAATRGRLDASAAAPLTITAGVDDTLNLTVDGHAFSVTLGAGTYASSDALAAELQSRINGAPTLAAAGSSVSVSHGAGVLQITSSAFGAGSSVAVTGGNGAATLFGATPTATAGVDVAGTIAGAAATGSGQVLSSPGGLRVRAATDATGALGSVSFTRGYGALLAEALRKITDTGGPIGSRTDGLNASIKRNAKQQEDFNTRMTALESRYRRQFTALDSMLSSMGTTSSYLSQQFAAMAKANG
ncbi:MAG: flagellar filament capping protein FliD [Burkholderiales bacterium]|nr:flagellar filament capping protein FliD [Burkholderiales bacterium]